MGIPFVFARSFFKNVCHLTLNSVHYRVVADMEMTMLVYRVAHFALARYSPQQMANPKGKNSGNSCGLPSFTVQSQCDIITYSDT
jgi:hypothetical protein